MANKVQFVDPQHPPLPSHSSGQIWRYKDGTPYILTRDNGMWMAISLVDGNGWDDWSTHPSNAVHNLELVGFCNITVEPIYRKDQE